MAEQELISKMEWAYLERSLTQLGHISAARNLILHYGVEHLATKRARATNELRAVNREKARSVPATIKDLENMTGDLEEIAHKLFIFNRGRQPLKHEVREGVEWLRSPWRYTLPQPKQNRRHPNGKSAKQRRLP